VAEVAAGKSHKGGIAMLCEKRPLEGLAKGGIAKFAAVATLTAGIACFPPAATAQQPGQRSFPSAEEACKALVAALQTNDQTALLSLLGPEGKEIISSGDPVEDKENHAEFVQKYQQMHRLVTEPDGTTTLYIGAENWPTPIPLVHKGSTWYFDTAAGKEEILYRRIGRNELAVIQVCRELVDAEKEYYAVPHDGDSGRQYAQKFFSDPNKHNGLYWEPGPGEPESPIGPLLASAAAEGYAQNPDHQPQPFHGYYFRILTGQTANAPGGARSYIVDGKMTGGFAFLAYPAEYRSSGVMTFIVDQDGIVYEKDLGPNTADIARNMTRYARDSSWRKAD
jgi:hypothetical protein